MLRRDSAFERDCARRASYLATRADVATSPNPRVGCVIADAHRIVAEGLFRRDGGPHAEIDALSRLPPPDDLPRAGLTAFVSLEPCSITGRTPPCADRLVREGIGRVVASALDQTPGVCGEGLARLRRGGVAVGFGLAQDLGYALARPRNVFATQQRPYTILKQAVTADGYVGRRGSRVAITGAIANHLTHQWRAEADAILVGVGTFLADAPSLTTRHVAGRDPAVVLYDPRGRLTPKQISAHFASPANRRGAPRRIYHAVVGADPVDDALTDAGFASLALERDTPVTSLGRGLHAHRIGRLLVEGGPVTLAAFAAAGAWDEYRRWRSPSALPEGPGEPVTAASFAALATSAGHVGADELTCYVPADRDVCGALKLH